MPHAPKRPMRLLTAVSLEHALEHANLRPDHVDEFLCLECIPLGAETLELADPARVSHFLHRNFVFTFDLAGRLSLLFLPAMTGSDYVLVNRWETEAVFLLMLQTLANEKLTNSSQAAMLWHLASAALPLYTPSVLSECLDTLAEAGALYMIAKWRLHAETP